MEAARPHEGDREGTARDHHRQAELPLRRRTEPARARSACSSTGESTEELAVLSRDVAHRLRDVPKRARAPCAPTARPGEQEVQVVVDRDRAVALGLTTQAVAHDGRGRDARRSTLEEFARGRPRNRRCASPSASRTTADAVEDLGRDAAHACRTARACRLGAVADFRIDQTARRSSVSTGSRPSSSRRILAGEASLDERPEARRAGHERLSAAAAASAGKYGRGVEDSDDTAIRPCQTEHARSRSR